jgi:hypothetical protein
MPGICFLADSPTPPVDQCSILKELLARTQIMLPNAGLRRSFAKRRLRWSRFRVELVLALVDAGVGLEHIKFAYAAPLLFLLASRTRPSR